MSLSTLIEAAKFLEQQEQDQKLQQMLSLTAAEPLPSTPQPALTIATPTAKSISLNQNGTVLLSSPGIALQGQLTLSTAPVVKKEQDHQVSSTVAGQPQRPRVLHNSFDIMNPLVIDESNRDVKRRVPPMVFRAGTREVHNKLEKHRRAHLKECFEFLKKQLPQNQDEKKTSNLSILHHALRYIQSLKRKEREMEHEIERLAREKISNQQRVLVLRKELPTPLPSEIAKLLLEFGGTNTNVEVKAESPVTTTSVIQQNGSEKVSIPILAKAQTPSVTTVNEVRILSRRRWTWIN